MDKTIEHIHAVLETTAKRWSEMAATLPAELLARVPAAGEWSAIECLHHLIDVEKQVFPFRVDTILSGKDLTVFDPDEQSGEFDHSRTAADLAAEFDRLRRESIRDSRHERS